MSEALAVDVLTVAFSVGVGVVFWLLMMISKVRR